MSEPGFEELQRLWQAPPAAAASAAPIILRQRRRRWLSRTYLWSEIVITLAAIPFSIWAAFQPNLLIIGVASLIFVLFSAGASLWARSIRPARVEDPLLASVDEGVRRARIGVRLAYATLWALVLSMIFAAMVGYIWWSKPEPPAAMSRRMVLAFVIWTVMFAVWIGATLAYLAARSRELTQMLLARDALRREM